MEENSITVEYTPYDYHKFLLELVVNAKQNFVLMGRMLYHLDQDESFKNVVGEGIDTWNEYLQQPEIGLSKGEANRLIQIYENFVLRLGFSIETVSEVPVKNLHYLLPLVKGTDDVDEVADLLADATMLSQKDFREKIYESKNPEEEQTYEYLIMKKSIQTGSLSKVHDIPSELIKETFKLE